MMMMMMMMMMVMMMMVYQNLDELRDIHSWSIGMLLFEVKLCLCLRTQFDTQWNMSYSSIRSSHFPLKIGILNMGMSKSYQPKMIENTSIRWVHSHMRV